MAKGLSKSAAGAAILALGVLLVIIGLFALWIESDRYAREGEKAAGSSAQRDAENDRAAQPRSEAVTAAAPGGAAHLQGGQLELPVDEGLEHQRSAAPESEVLDAATASLAREVEVRGMVRDARDGLPVEGVEIRLEAQSGGGPRALLKGVAQTDASGSFSLRWDATVSADLSLLHPEYVDARRPNVPLEQLLEVSLSPSARITGQVLGSAASLALAEDGVAPSALAWHARTSSESHWQKLEAPLEEGGGFLFDDLAAGDYVLTASVPGRAVPLVAGIHVDAGEERHVLLEALPGASVEGRVLRQALEKGGPATGIGGARLTLAARVDGLPDEALISRSAETVSDDDGGFLFEGFAPGTFRLVVALPWGERKSEYVTISSSGERQEIEVLCRAPSSMEGRVVDQSGQPVRNARLAVYIEKDGRRRAQIADWSFDSKVPTAVTDSRGAFRFDEVPARAPLSVAVSRPALPGAVQPSPLVLPLRALNVGEERLDVELVLPRQGVLHGTVLGPDERPVAGAAVELYREQEKIGMRLAMTRTDVDGRFELEGLPRGRAVVFARADGLLSLRQDVRIRGEDERIELVLQEALVVEGVALDEQGIAIPDVPVRLSIEPETPSPPEHAKRSRKHATATDAFGRFRFEGLFDAEWIVAGGSYEWELVGADPESVIPSLNGWTTLTFTPRDRAERFTIRGRVEGAGGMPPTGLRVEGLKGGLLEIDAGRFVATGLTPTRHRLTIHGDGHRRAIVGPIDPRPGGEVDLGLITLELGCRVTVSVLDDKGKAKTDAKVFLAPLPLAEGGPQDQRSIPLGHSNRGRYQTTQAARARYRLIVRADGFGTEVRKLKLEESPAVSLRVKLGRR